uniref:Uncharacterized protein n=1 Tax=Anopheles christyi TaxID=43041 RepID=A0A182JR84_9DIPT
NCCSNSYLRERLGQLGKDNDRYSPLTGYNQTSTSASVTGSSLDCLNLIVQSISNVPQAAQLMQAQTSSQANHTPPVNGLTTIVNGGATADRTNATQLHQHQLLYSSFCSHSPASSTSSSSSSSSSASSSSSSASSPMSPACAGSHHHQHASMGCNRTLAPTTTSVSLP